MGDCQHLDITDQGICKACGVDITSQEFLDSLPEAPPDSELGDICGLVRLAQETAEEFVRRQADIRDPHNPAQPKIRWVGTQMVRVPRETIWTEILRPSFARAKKLGYRSDYERWQDICMEYVHSIKSKKKLQKT